MRILVKLGGTLLDSPESRHRLAREIGALGRSQEPGSQELGSQEPGAASQEARHSVVVVHGGGKQMTRYLAEKGIESRFVDGLRVTTPDVLDGVLKVLAGTVNQELVAAFIAAGSSAVGLSGVDALLAEAEQMSPELGFVGRTVHSDARLLDILTGHGYLPVVACVAADRNGQIYNVNADQMAVACAAGFRADKLLFLTDVDGVRGAANEILPVITPEQCRNLISSGVATGGMQAKLNAATDALRRGVGEVVIAPGALPGIVQKLIAGEALGTRLTAAAEVALQ